MKFKKHIFIRLQQLNIGIPLSFSPTTVPFSAKRTPPLTKLIYFTLGLFYNINLTLYYTLYHITSSRDELPKNE